MTVQKGFLILCKAPATRRRIPVPRNGPRHVTSSRSTARPRTRPGPLASGSRSPKNPRSRPKKTKSHLLPSSPPPEIRAKRAAREPGRSSHLSSPEIGKMHCSSFVFTGRGSRGMGGRSVRPGAGGARSECCLWLVAFSSGASGLGYSVLSWSLWIPRVGLVIRLWAGGAPSLAIFFGIHACRED